MSAPPLQIIPLKEGDSLSEFIQLPERLYQGQPGYAPPLRLERQDILSKKKNPYFQHADAALFLAKRGRQIVGRISAQIDQLYIQKHDPVTGHIGFIDAIDDAAVFASLLEAAETWLRTRGMRRVIGPYSFSSNEESGLMVDGFSSRPMIMMGFHLPYAGTLVEACGYHKIKDLLAYSYILEGSRPIDRHRLIARLREDNRIQIRPLRRSPVHYRQDLSNILAIYNDAWADNWGAVPFTEDEVRHAAQSLRPLIRSHLTWIAEIDGAPAAMIVGLPNLLEAAAGLGGRLLPFGWAKLLWRLYGRRMDSLRVPLFGVRRMYHRSPIASALIFMLLEALRKASLESGFRHAELSWILEDNLPMRQVIESIGGEVYKTYRIYEKRLT